MNLCNNSHDEVCYEGRSCPACEKQNEINDLNAVIEDLNNTIIELEARGE
jgi:transcription initiation factor IIE alpha subunit